MKTIAFYLPQFHTIPENDEWWGKGFTEWTTVKKAKPLFKNHIQPEVPYNNNYYCLLDEDVQVAQADLARKYGLDAFCYYHYWFDGKLLLEKPLENMLKNNKINIDYCLCWANESWARTWDGKESNVLMQQNYNEGVEGWKKHYLYLSQYFKDERYIKDNNKPLIIIYKPQLINDFQNMMNCWNNLAIEEGYSGLTFAYQHPSAFQNNAVVQNFDFGIEFEPLYTNAIMEGERAFLIGKNRLMYGIMHPLWLCSKIYKRIRRLPSIQDYDVVWKNIIERKPINLKIAAGAFTSWDNTPRKGKNGIVYFGANPEKFQKYMVERYKSISEKYGIPYLFINAWNEWGEGAHLEPDEHFQYGYLEALKFAKNTFSILSEGISNEQ